MLWEDAPQELCLSHAVNAFYQRRGTHIQPIAFGPLYCPPERVEQYLPEPLVDFVEGPHIILGVLHPLEIGNRNPSGVFRARPEE